MQLNHRAHPPTPDPCLLTVLSGTLRVPPYPDTQGDRPALEPMGQSVALGTWLRGLAGHRPSVNQHPTPSQRQDRDLEATLGRTTPARPPTLPFWAAALPRWASLNSPIAYLDHWTRNPATLPSFFRLSFDPHVPRTTTASLRNPSSPSLSPADLSSHACSLARSLTFSIPSAPACCSLPATPLDPPCDERPATTHTQPVPTITARHQRHGHPLCKADRPPSLPACPPTNKPLSPSNPVTNITTQKIRRIRHDRYAQDYCQPGS